MTDQEKEQAEKDLLELVDIATDKQIDDIKKTKSKKTNDSSNKRPNNLN